MRILHLADVHLDRPFVGLPLDSAHRRREELRLALERCLGLAREREADVVTIAGDLWEEEHVTADTRMWVTSKFDALDVPVLVVCGNHDPLVAGGSHARTTWPPNVHHFERAQPTEYVLDGASIWGVSWGGGAFSTSFLDSFRTPRDGHKHALLLHGTASDSAAFLDQEGRYGPFDAQSVTRAGFACCLAGHIHAAHEVGPVVYPGSPEPLGWSETGRHCVAVIDVHEEGIETELVDVNAREYLHRRVPVEGAMSSADIERALDLALTDADPSRCYVRVTLTGQIDGACAVRPDALAMRRPEYAGLTIIDETRPNFDFAALARQPTALGRFVRQMSEQIAGEARDTERKTLELALLAGVRAMNGETEVLYVD